MKRFFLSFLLIFFVSGCGTVAYKQIHTPKDEPKIEKLKKELLTVSDNPKEAQELAELAIAYSKVLANRYNLVSPPLYHNFLVNIGQRKRGLCFHFVEDLMQEINRHDFKSFHFRWGRANGDKFDEHNVIVVTGNKNDNFSDGIILDAWRNSGNLVFWPVKDDPKYRFIEWDEGNRRIAK